MGTHQAQLGEPESRHTVQLTRRSCCWCSAAPAFTVVITSKVPVRHSVDVLMCEHHYQQCAPALTCLTPLVFDRDGHSVAATTSR